MLVTKMKQAADSKGIDCKIDALSVNAFDDAIKEYDVCLLGPQVRFQLEELQKTAQSYGKSIAAICPQAYGMMKGDEVLSQALKLIK
jgi:PTS system cellobiose-specific IIB component